MSRQALEAALSRSVSLEELRHALESPISADEREQVRQLVRWFTTRYATAESRLAYVRQAVARWQRGRFLTGVPEPL
jgi:hypothetical protein